MRDGTGLYFGGGGVNGRMKLSLVVGLLGFCFWFGTLPCSSIKPKKWCQPPELTVGRAIAFALVKKWGYLVQGRRRQ